MPWTGNHEQFKEEMDDVIALMLSVGSGIISGVIVSPISLRLADHCQVQFKSDPGFGVRQRPPLAAAGSAASTDSAAGMITQ